MNNTFFAAPNGSALGTEDYKAVAILPPEFELDRIEKSKGIRQYFFDARFSVNQYKPISYHVHVINEPRDFHMKHILLTVFEQGLTYPLGFADSRLSHTGEYYDLNYFYRNGCFGSRNEQLPSYCWIWEGCMTGLPYGKLRLGKHNPGGRYNLMVLPDYQGKGLARNMIATASEIAKRMGARYMAHSGKKLPALSRGVDDWD